MRVLIDTNVILDLICIRRAYVREAHKIISLCAEKKLEGYIAPQSFVEIHSILRNVMTFDERRRLLTGFCWLLTVVGIDRDIIIATLENENFADVEDSLISQCAKSCGAEYIITRNTENFQNSSVPAITPADFVNLL